MECAWKWTLSSRRWRLQYEIYYYISFYFSAKNAIKNHCFVLYSYCVWAQKISIFLSAVNWPSFGLFVNFSFSFYCFVFLGCRIDRVILKWMRHRDRHVKWHEWRFNDQIMAMTHPLHRYSWKQNKTVEKQRHCNTTLSFRIVMKLKRKRNEWITLNGRIHR